MSAFDDLLDLGGPTTTETSGQPSDPFDPMASSGGGQDSGSGNLLDFGLDTTSSSQNGGSAKLTFEANTNPLYEFTSNQNIMSADASNALLDFNGDAEVVTQKEAVKSEPSNPLYDFAQKEETNGHAEDLFTNGAGEVENGNVDNGIIDQNGDDFEKPEQQEVDLLGAGDFGNSDVVATETTGDLLGGPMTSDDSGVTVDSSNMSGELLLGETTAADTEETVEQEEQDDKTATAVEDLQETKETPAEKEDQTTPEDQGPKTEEEPEQGTSEQQQQQQGSEDMNGNNEPELLVEGTDQFDDAVDAKVEEKEAVEEGQAEDDVAAPETQAVAEATADTEEAGDEENGNVVEQEVQQEEAAAVEPEPVKDEVKDQTESVDEPEPVQSEPEAVVEEVQEKTEEEPVETAVEPKVEPETSEEPEPAPIELQPESEAENKTDVVEAEQVEEPIAEPEAPKEETVEPVEEIADQPAPQEVEPVAEPAAPEEPAPVIEPEPAMEVEAAPEPEEKVEEAPVVEEEDKAESDKVEPEDQDTGVSTYKSTSFLLLSPTTPTAPSVTSLGNGRFHEDGSVGTTRNEEVPTAGTRTSVVEEDNALKMNGASDVKENGVESEDAVRDPNVFRETRDKEEVHFAEMNNVRQKFESGGAQEEAAPKNISIKDEYDQGGEFENEPVQNPDVVKETDQPGEELPEVGMAKNLRNRFQAIQEEKAKPVASQKRVSPPRADEKVEYESTPSESQVHYEEKVDSGVYESQPQDVEGVVKSGDAQEDFTPEKGYAKNIMNKFKEIQTEGAKQKSESKREITPDRSGKVEYVSEPRGAHITYEESKTESGVFENVPKSEEDVVKSGEKAEEAMPETGMAKNLLSRFKQMEAEAGNKPPPSPGRVREITPDRSGKVEFVSEPRGFLEKYEPQTESGEYESTPQTRPEVIRSEERGEDVLPETGSAKKTMERFKEMQKQSTSPKQRSKEFTPPRESSPGRSTAGVYENTPQIRDDVVHCGEVANEDLPEQGTTRNILNRFKEIQSHSQSVSPGSKQKEFTPPPESGVYENQPKEHLVIETRQSESGILESTPQKSTADVARERDSVSPEAELPEQGTAKNLVSKFRQMESTSATRSASSKSPGFKEFTPPRDSRGPLSPKSPAADPSQTNGVHPSDLPGQYQPQVGASVVENNPEQRENVFREADTDWEKDMPAKNTTSSMLQKFKAIQEKAKTEGDSPAPVSRKEKAMFRTVQLEKCSACEKTVYAMEKLEMNGHVYHKQCFKCSHCSARLTPKNFSMNEGVIYCVNHFKQLFARKGNYDEGFGRQQYKKKWQETKKEGEGATA